MDKINPDATMQPAFYAIIPADVRYDTRLRANAKLLYGEISALCKAKGFCWAPNRYFAGLYEMTEKSVSRLINQLAECGYIWTKVEKCSDSHTVIGRKIYLAERFLVEDEATPPKSPVDESQSPKKSIPIPQKVQENNTSNITPPVIPRKGKATDAEIVALFDEFSRDQDGGERLKKCLADFAAARRDALSPIATKMAATKLVNRLVRYSGGDVCVMCTMLDKATERGWKSVYELSQQEADEAHRFWSDDQSQPTEGGGAEWL